MLKQEITDLLNGQINKEFYSSYFYLDMSNYFCAKNLTGFGKWFDSLAKEEFRHGMKMMKYLQKNVETVVLDTILAPKEKFTEIRDVLRTTLGHEMIISQEINNIYAQAYEIKDFKTMQFLDWFVKKQGDQEKRVSDLCKRFELFGSDTQGLYMMDMELGTSSQVFDHQIAMTV
jgi:ferritin